MAADEWRLCVDWLVKCHILPEDHRAKKPDAQIFDLAQALRDGVLLCHLLNYLSPNCIDPRDFSPRPQLSQFLCLKNIRTFLQTCEKIFRVRSNDLYDPHDLFDVKNFRKVLHTLSKLSKTELALQRQSGFPPDSSHMYDHEYYNTLEDLAHGFPPDSHRSNDNEDDIYGNLQDMALLTDVPEEQEVRVDKEIHEEKIYDDLCSLKSDHDLDDNEDLYSCVYQEEDEDIYEDLCSTQRKPRQSIELKEIQEEEVSELPAPVTKKDYCLKEMVDTERNYVDALRMICQFFIKPLKSTFPLQESKTVFSNIESLLEIHTGFHSEIQRACTSSNDSKISAVFVTWKSKFLLYGDYCSNLPQAQEHLEELTKKNETYRSSIEECERKANDGRFKLRDLLHVPMQRVLKYHLLLKELIKSTDKMSEDRRGLETALEAMQDLSLYINEVKRDNEALQLIQEIQNSITDLQMPVNTSLKDYGRLQKDGELKVRNHIENKVHQRYIFLFDKVMLMAKSKGETYSFKEAIVLAEFRIDNTAMNRDRDRRPEKWNCSFQMVKKDNHLVYTFYAKTEEMKNKWIEGIKLALDNTQPQNGANYIMTTFPDPTVCDVCGKLLRGVFFQGYRCPEGKKNCHKECIGKATEKVPFVPPRVTEPVAKTTPANKVKADTDYSGQPNPGGGKKVLKFSKGDVIEILKRMDSGWFMGRFRGNEGWFPSQLVTEMENRLCPSYHTSVDEEVAPVVSLSLSVSQTNQDPQLSRKPSYLPVHGSRNKAPTLTPQSNPDLGISSRLHDELMKFDWYVGSMSRDDGSELMKNLPNGSFLVRDSANPGRLGQPALTLKYSNNVRHIRIERNSDGYFLSDIRYFHTLPELVEFYSKSTLAESFPEVKTSLQYPYKTVSSSGASNGDVNGMMSPPPRPATRSAGAVGPAQKTPMTTPLGNRIISYAYAVYDYAANATSQLSLSRGDRVAVLSKTGSDKGWWKGEHCESRKVGYFPFAYVQEEDEE